MSMRRGRSETLSCRRTVADSGISEGISLSLTLYNMRLCVDEGIKTFPMTRVVWGVGLATAGASTRATGHLSPRAGYKYVYIYIYNMVCIGKAFTRMSPGIPVPHTNNVFMCARRRNDFHSDSDPHTSFARFLFCFLFYFYFFFTVLNSRCFPLHAGSLLA